MENNFTGICAKCDHRNECPTATQMVEQHKTLVGCSACHINKAVNTKLPTE